MELEGEFCEFRIMTTYKSSNGNISYFYTFEHEKLGSFKLWCKEKLVLEKGKLYRPIFYLSFYQDNVQVRLVGCKDE